MKRRLIILSCALLGLGTLISAGVFFWNPRWLNLLSNFDVGLDVTENDHPARERQSAHGQKEIPKASTEARTQESVPALEQASQSQVEIAAAPDFELPMTQASQIVTTMREISALQTEMAHGKAGSSQKLRASMLRARSLLSKADTVNLKYHDVESLAQYFLSGGDPSVASKFINVSTLSEAHSRLLNGVISYANADFEKAKEQLSTLDSRQFSTMLDSQFTMVRTQLEAADDPVLGLKRLAYVADIVPGTLIEEAAIRRMIPLLSQRGEEGDLLYWSTRYLRRFPNSLYYRDFELSIVDVLTYQASIEQVADEAVLTGIFKFAGQARSASLSKQILERAVTAGYIARCESIAASLRQNFDFEMSAFADTAALLKICRAADGQKSNLLELKGIDASSLSASVRAILLRAITLSEAIHLDMPLKNDGSFGPHLPLSQSVDYGTLFASVTQQLDATVSAIRKAGDHENGIDK